MQPKSKYEKPKKYSFFSDGNSYDFNPEKRVSFGGELISALDFHKQEVKHRRSKRVFILDETGKVLKID